MEQGNSPKVMDDDRSWSSRWLESKGKPAVDRYLTPSTAQMQRSLAVRLMSVRSVACSLARLVGMVAAACRYHYHHIPLPPPAHSLSCSFFAFSFLLRVHHLTPLLLLRTDHLCEQNCMRVCAQPRVPFCANVCHLRIHVIRI